MIFADFTFVTFTTNFWVVETVCDVNLRHGCGGCGLVRLCVVKLPATRACVSAAVTPEEGR